MGGIFGKKVVEHNTSNRGYIYDNNRPRPASSRSSREFNTVNHNQPTLDNLYRAFSQFQSQNEHQFRLPAFTEYRAPIQTPTRSFNPAPRAETSKFIPIVGAIQVVVSYRGLDVFDWEFQQIARLVSKKDNFKIVSIEKVENPYLQAAYELKKIQKERRNDVSEERYLFHGTKQSIVDTICRNNFDWRKCQQHKFGKGVSFSPNSTYASNYSDRNVLLKVMLVAKVLIGNTCTGNQFMELPAPGCDTSEKPGGVVIVKFDDNEFYPAYKITYYLVNENQGRATRQRRYPRHL